MKYEEIVKLLNYDFKESRESKLFMPNEIFDNLKDNIEKSPHIAFSYSYIYLVTWLYRYAKIFTGDNKSVINNNIIKELLGYNPKNQTVNYLIKRNGLLEKINYLESVKDFPYVQSYSDEEGLKFEMYSNFKDFHYMHPKIAKSFFFRYPIKSLDDRIVEIRKEDIDKDKDKDTEDKQAEAKKERIELKGIFYDVAYTHMIPFEVFLYCMSTKEMKRNNEVVNESVGTVGFYLYAFLKHKTDIHKDKGGYTASLPIIVKETGIPERTLVRCLNILKERDMIDFYHNIDHYVPSLPKHLRIGNTYIAKNYEDFNYGNIPQKYKNIGFMSFKDFSIKQETDNSNLNDLFVQ